MDGPSRRPPLQSLREGTPKRERGAEWWGKSPFGYFWGSFPKVTRCKSGTHIRHHPNNGYVPSGPRNPHRTKFVKNMCRNLCRDSGESANNFYLIGRHRGQARSHILILIGLQEARSIRRFPQG